MDAQPDTTPTRRAPEVIGPPAAGWPARQPAAAEDARQTPADGPLSVLIVCDRPVWSGRLKAALETLGAECDEVRSLHAAREALAARRGTALTPGSRLPASQFAAALPDVILADCALPDGDAMTLADECETAQIPVLLAGKHVSADLGYCAMLRSVAGLVSHEDPADSDLAARILVVAARSRNQRRERSEQQRRFFRLRGAPNRFNLLPGRAPDPRASDLVCDHAERAQHMKQNVSTVSDYKGLIRAELDIEVLLRTTLEFVLARSGPTNAAVFLPTTSGDYSLGAYVNYDCPKETCDVLLDHLANAVAPRFESVKAPGGMAHLTTQAALDEYLEKDADWLSGSHVVGFPCRHDDECLAIFMLFRDSRSPFSAPLLEQVKTVGELFAAQLARVIHIHHRHLPKSKWGMIGDPPAERDDYGDLAA